MQSILCPVDFSESSRAALRTAVRFVRQFHGRLDVLFVQHPLLASTRVEGKRTAPPLQEELRRFVAETPDLELDAEPEIHVVIGAGAKGIVDFATRQKADAIVMGMHGLTGTGKPFFGSTAARVLRRAPMPTVLVPSANGSDKARDLAGLGAILVLTDFGAAAAAVSHIAAQIGTVVGARLVLVHVLPPISAPASWRPAVDAAMKQRTSEAHQEVCRAMAPLEQYGPVESVIAQGNIAASVADLARTHHAGLIVLGLEGDARESKAGSTAYAIACSAPVPVLVVPCLAASQARQAGEMTDVQEGHHE